MVDPETHQILIAWAQWARGNAIGAPQPPQAGSAESAYLPEAGEVHHGVSGLLEAARSQPAEAEQIAVEIIVMRMPKKQALALRLNYVQYRRMPVRQKLSLLRVTYDEYRRLVADGARMVSEALQEAEREAA